ncbi:hypothetical protein BKH41_03115 [Helicobacter sp. 12S02232-10]|uniref:outer membrane beta-barrel protein n=1 Tax=Helicobacter sp. 12S02232-10 TaxID=1476197 RepID=UPI000BA619E2|nr:outer membrane beta-barrel protein [Helicobacter sp. 12S02232-10]PAF49094.1 hypothetical protein BKH41_03115 [Helicobacter sp. 12S02232-10]
MFFKRLILCLLFALSFSFGLETDKPADQKRQVYMLKGQLYEQEQKLRLEEMAKEKNGFFVGLILGNITLNATPAGYVDSHPFLYGARVGYQQYLKDYIGGLRFYGEYLRGDMESMAYQLASFNLDLIADVPLDDDKKYALGVFGGVGMGWMDYADQAVKPPLSQFGVVINLGIALTLNIRHRIELGLKIPPIKTKETSLYRFATTNAYLISYNLLF